MIYNSTYSSALVEDGNLVAFIEDERVTRIKKKEYLTSRTYMERLEDKLHGNNSETKENNNNVKFDKYSHHLQHAVAAYYQSGFKDASILVMDGIDEAGKFSTAIFSAKDEEITEIKKYPASYSLGYLYNYGAIYCGLVRSDGEGHPGKLMGLATYGKNDYILSEPYFTVNEDTGEITSESFGVKHIEAQIRKNIDLGLDQRRSKSVFEYAEVANYIQQLFEDSVWSLLTFMKNKLPSKNLVISGGCGLNCTMNGKIARSRMFENFFVPPLCEDAGNILGVMILDRALNLSSPVVYNKIKPRIKDDDLIRKVSQDEVAELIRDGKPIAWFEGGSEHGPRALGHRSILADPTSRYMKYLVNQIKNREYWRPFAPIVLDSYFKFMFYTKPKYSPLYKYMLATERVRSECQHLYPAILAPDGTTRPQALFDTKENHNLYHFMAEHAMPVLLNTSLNGKDEPIIETVTEAKNFCNRVEIPLVIVKENGEMFLGGDY